MDDETMTIQQIINQQREEARVETFQLINRSKQLELLKLHNILVYKKLKRTEADLGIRKRMFKVYLILITERNIESIYNLKIQVFCEEFYGCTLKGITD